MACKTDVGSYGRHDTCNRNTECPQACFVDAFGCKPPNFFAVKQYFLDLGLVLTDMFLNKATHYPRDPLVV